MPSPRVQDALRPSSAPFATTAWSRVLRAAAPDNPDAKPALADLCRAYWYPLYAYSRRRGNSPAEAEDAVQGFFAWLLEKNIIQYANPERGRFRGFLVACFRQFLAREHQRATAEKRQPPGGLLSIDIAAGESRYSHEPADTMTPERIYEYTWAVAVLQRAMDRLRAECEADGKRNRLEAFHGLLTGQAAKSVKEVGASLGITEGAARVALHRLRQRYGDLIRQEVAGTLDESENIEQELRELHQALRL